MIQVIRIGGAFLVDLGGVDQRGRSSYGIAASLAYRVIALGTISNEILV